MNSNISKGDQNIYNCSQCKASTSSGDNDFIGSIGRYQGNIFTKSKDKYQVRHWCPEQSRNPDRELKSPHISKHADTQC